jgi:hypothetical protein
MRDEDSECTRFTAWSLTSLQQRRMKAGGRVIKHARYSCGTPLISLGSALAASSFCLGLEKRTMHKRESQIGNSGFDASCLDILPHSA